MMTTPLSNASGCGLGLDGFKSVVSSEGWNIVSHNELPNMVRALIISNQ